jgi:hypothetical protein
VPEEDGAREYIVSVYIQQRAMYRQTKSPAESCTFQTERRVVVVDSGNERFFSIRFCSDTEKDVMRHFHAPFGSYPFVSSPNRH